MKTFFTPFISKDALEVRPVSYGLHQGNHTYFIGNMRPSASIGSQCSEYIFARRSSTSARYLLKIMHLCHSFYFTHNGFNTSALHDPALVMRQGAKRA